MQAHLSFRIPTEHWLKPEQYEKLKYFLQKYGPVDEIALFTSGVHSATPLPELMRRFDILEKIIPELKKIVPRVGVNHLCSVGHAIEDTAHANQVGQLFVTNKGTASPGNFCPEDPVFRKEYLGPAYRRLAACNPDFIWIDDDLRYTNHGKNGHYGCFCPECLKKFAARFGCEADLESVLNYPEHENPDERRKRRKELAGFIAEKINDISSFIEKEVHSVNPDIILGQMTGYSPYNGLDSAGRVNALSGSGKTPVWWRPGGGFYTDAVPDSMVAKAHNFGGQIALLPPEVEVIEAELESFNYPLLSKSAFFTTLEPQIYCAVGSTGCACNIFGYSTWEDLERYWDLAAKLLKTKPFLDRIVGAAGRTPARGVFCGYDKGFFAGLNINTKWYEGKGATMEPGFMFSMLQKIGIPTAYDWESAELFALDAGSATALEDDQIKYILSKGVYMDVPALQILNARGFGALTGITVADTINADAIERATDHPLNCGRGGFERNGRQSFWPQSAYVLSGPSSTEILSSCVDYEGEELAPALFCIYENEIGGRVAVNGYYPWDQCGYSWKCEQMKALFNWLSKDSISGYVASFHKCALWLRGNAVFFANMTFDPAEEVLIKMRTSSNRMKITLADLSEQYVNGTPDNNGMMDFYLPVIPPWSLVSGELL